MKRLFAPLFLIVLLLTGCEIKEYTPEIPLTFIQRAKVSSGDFSFDCEICKNLNDVSVTVLSTQAKGMVMTYDGRNMDFSYEKLNSTISSDGIECSNVAVVIYEVFECLSADAQSGALKTDSGYQYKGRASAGEFTLFQNEDNTFSSLVIPTAALSIEFIMS